ncbi:putative cysteine protease YraA [Botrimarina colliarenosi]|uniref:Putative cysteine protease YraA n=1 Tax=Botrimarina colliarenosi TaxID=2528001 RepID=A0A5C6AJ76_9BACT|nr:type 1 glutamine amidotransferase domain-containing protein [Botrimarina colliarenosi]TWT99298.1 putative cysteine protease YraA [Botrimarina colliarenosi]
MSNKQKSECTDELKGKRVAILATDGFEQVELTRPRDAITEAGGDVQIVSLDMGEIQGMHHDQLGDKVTVDAIVASANPHDYDALVLPGGVQNPDTLRKSADAVEFVRAFFEQHKPVAAICHGPWMLVEAGVVQGRRVTSYASLKTDLINAGANWVDEECVCDEGLVTSRTPEDLTAFCEKMVEEIAEGKHAAQVA